MNRAWIAALGIGALAVSAFGVYFSQRSPSLDQAGVSASLQPTVFRVLANPTTVPDVTFADGEGQPRRLSDFRGKTILLNIWATWCAPCRQEMPALDRLQAKLGGPRFEVVALSIDRGGAVAVKSFYEELDIRKLGVYVDVSGRATSDLNTIGLPTTLLIDGQGREIGRKVGPAEWDSADMVKLIEKYLEPPAARASGQS